MAHSPGKLEVTELTGAEIDDHRYRDLLLVDTFEACMAVYIQFRNEGLDTVDKQCLDALLKAQGMACTIDDVLRVVEITEPDVELWDIRDRAIRKAFRLAEDLEAEQERNQVYVRVKGHVQELGDEEALLILVESFRTIEECVEVIRSFHSASVHTAAMLRGAALIQAAERREQMAEQSALEPVRRKALEVRMSEMAATAKRERRKAKNPVTPEG